jgi:hypothetical protein
LIGAAIIGTAVSTSGLLWISKADAKEALLDYFKRMLPGATIDVKSASVCIDDFMERWANPPMLVRPSHDILLTSMVKIQFVVAAWQVMGVENLSKLHEKFELVARKALTFFLLNSNFFQTDDPRLEPIVYVAKSPGAACSNPFANLDPPVIGQLSEEVKRN